MADAKTHRGTVVRDFNVLKEGVTTRYTAGDTKVFDAGEYINFERAGLVGKPSEVEITESKSSAKNAD